MAKFTFKIGTKSLISYGVVVILFLGVVVYSIFTINSLMLNTRTINDLNQLNAHIIHKHVDHLKWAAEVNKVLIDERSTTLDVEIDPHKCAFGKWYYSNNRLDAEKKIPELINIFQRIEQPHSNLHKSAEEISSLLKDKQTAHNSLQTNIMSEAKGVYQNVTLAELHNVGSIIQEIENIYANKIEADEKAIYSNGSNTRTIVLIISIITTIIAVLISVFASRSIVKPLVRFQELFFKLSRGELNVHYPTKKVNCSRVMGCGKTNCPDYGKDGVLCYFDVGSFAPEFGKEVHCPKIIKGTYKSCKECKVYKMIANNEIDSLGAWLNVYTDKLRDMIGTIKNGAGNVASASRETSFAAQQLSQNASTQAASIEEISATMEEIVSSIQQNTDNAKQTSSITENSTTGIENMGQTSKKSLESVKKITEKINIINDIAFQTNILALNAAVEAARAGVHGKGFAVVATEVRNLAEMSKNAANEIINLAQTSKDVTENVNAIIEELVPSIKKITILIQEISEASTKQNAGVSEINTTMQNLNDITQKNASSSEELASNAEELEAQAAQLKEIVDYFKN